MTITSGRNRLLGERIGAGETVADAVHSLAAADTTIEGYAATGFGHRLAQGFIAAGVLRSAQVPLLDGLWRVLYSGAPPRETLWAAARREAIGDG